MSKSFYQNWKEQVREHKSEIIEVAAGIVTILVSITAKALIKLIKKEGEKS